MLIGLIGTGDLVEELALLMAYQRCSVVVMVSGADSAEVMQDHLRNRLRSMVAGRALSSGEASRVEENINLAADAKSMDGCEWVLEALDHDLDAKVKILLPVIPVVDPSAVFSTTESLCSVSELGRRLRIPERVCGTHFVHPTTQVGLVELVHGVQTDPAVLDRVAQQMTGWGATLVRVKDSPGLIVDRVMRPFVLEALRIVEERLAACESVDLIVKEMGGFRNGPFEMMDNLGLDVDYRMTQDLYQRLNKSAGQQKKDKPQK